MEENISEIIINLWRKGIKTQGSFNRQCMQPKELKSPCGCSNFFAGKVVGVGWECVSAEVQGRGYNGFVLENE